MMFPSLASYRQVAQSQPRRTGADEPLSCAPLFSASDLVLHCLTALASNCILPVLL